MEKISEELEKNVEILRSGYTNYKDLKNASFLIANEELSALTMTPLDTLKRYNNWYFYEGDYYYLKELGSIIGLINELLGQYLSEYMELPTIEYHVVQRDDKIVGLFSRNFKSSSYDYSLGMYASKNLVSDIRKILTDKDYECNEDIRKQVTSYVVRNYYSALKDRLMNSMYAHNSKEKFIMAPLHDYESSFMDSEMMTYIDPLINYCFNYESCESLRHNNKYYAESLEKIYGFDILSALKVISDKYSIVIPSKVKDYYESFDKERKNFMKHMGVH